MIDDFGVEFDQFEEARNHAVSLLPDIAREELPNGTRRDFICDIRTEEGHVIYRATLKFRENRFETNIQPIAAGLSHERCTDDVTATDSHIPLRQAGKEMRHGETEVALDARSHWPR